MEPEVRFARIEALLHAMAERGNQMDQRMDRADQRHEQAMRRMDGADERHERAMRRMDGDDQRHAQAMLRMDRADQKAERRHKEAMLRMDRAEQRMVVFDRRLEATRKLVEAGIKMVAGMRQRNKETEEIVRDLAKTQKAFLDSLKRGRNGSGHTN